MMNLKRCRAGRRWAIETVSAQAIVRHLQALGGEILSKVEERLVLLTLASFIAGMFLARVSPSFGKAITSGVSGFMDAYDTVGPLTVFVIIAPALAEMLVTRQKGKFGVHVIRWYAGRKALASLWAVVFTVLVFSLPILPARSASLGEALSQTLLSTATMAIRSPYYLAMYAGLAVALVSLRVRRLHVVLTKSADVVERAGQLFFPFVPLLMLAAGTYVYTLPQSLKQRFGPEVAALSPMNVWGMKLDPSNATGMVFIYLLGSILVAIACFIWHLSLVGLCMHRSRRFSVRTYFTGFWIPTYPLLWATSSEALATPLVLHLIKKHAPWVKGIVRRFVGGVGSYLDANGTIICVYVLAGLVAAILGLPFSLLEFAASIPLIVLLSYGIPGIPGELIIFAGPIALLMNVPQATLPIFLALYIGLQMGLPDSFRTGANSTDDFLNAVLMNRDYERSFMEAKEDAEVGQDWSSFQRVHPENHEEVDKRRITPLKDGTKRTGCECGSGLREGVRAERDVRGLGRPWDQAFPSNTRSQERRRLCPDRGAGGELHYNRIGKTRTLTARENSEP